MRTREQKKGIMNRKDVSCGCPSKFSILLNEK